MVPAATNADEVNHPYFTIGHSTRSVEEFVELLRAGAVTMVVDIRTVPRSRTNPQYNEEVLGSHLAEYQIGHCRIASLGGLRKKVPEVPDHVNGWWQNRSFHNYADHALSEEFRAGLQELRELGRSRRVAMMCSEAVWWRCHRRIVADHLLAQGGTVFHLMDRKILAPAQLSPGAKVQGERLTYPA